MGLLDDAIREHLELKRLRGADPGLVAREEHDALGPVSRGDGGSDDEHQESQTDEAPSAKGSFFAESEPMPAADFSTVGQETAEIDMNAVLDSDHDVEGSLAATDYERTPTETPSAHTRTTAEDSLEWEMPGDEPTGIGDDQADDPDTTGQVDDVLEETPDFLRDTPEQERLWFEQRPPRDFDFNE